MADEVLDAVRALGISGGVVVGDDGSEAAARAVRYGLEEAGRRGCRLHVLRAWSLLSAARPADAAEGYVPPLAQFEAATRDVQARRLARLVGGTDVEVHSHLVHAPAVRALVAASRDADVLVVARRGGGGFSSLVLGSVAEQCVRHAACPVVVVHAG